VQTVVIKYDHGEDTRTDFDSSELIEILDDRWYQYGKTIRNKQTHKSRRVWVPYNQPNHERKKEFSLLRYDPTDAMFDVTARRTASRR